MTLDFDENGRLSLIQKVVTDFLDQQMFVYPEFKNQIAGLRGGVVGLCVGCSADVVGNISGHLYCDGSSLESALSVSLVGMTPTELMVSRAPVVGVQLI